MLKLEKGMIVQLLEDIIYYHYITFKPITIPKGTFGEIEHVRVEFPENIDIPPNLVVSVKYKDNGTSLYHIETMREFRKIHKIIKDDNGYENK
jgi:hypothetical protein